LSNQIGRTICLPVTQKSYGEAARGQSVGEIEVLDGQVTELYEQGQYAEAIAIAQQCLTLAEQAPGSEHPATRFARLPTLRSSRSSQWRG
jgi:hypothetical protein